MEPSSLLRLGALVGVGTVAFAGLVGLVAVVDADRAAGAAGIGFGVAVIVFVTGATMACALACLVRRRLERSALVAIGVAGLAMDLAVLAIWQEIDSEAYGKVTVIAFVWAVIAVLILGLTLAVGQPGDQARYVYLAALVAAVAAGLIATWLVATAGGDGVAYEVFGSPFGALGDDGLLRALGAALVLVATLWFAALAASRFERASSSSGADHGL